ncbi:peptidase M16, partial [Streptomyces albidoflavus]
MRRPPASPARSRGSPRATCSAVIVDRPGAVQTQLLIGRVGPDRHDRVWPAQVLGTF